MSEVKFKLKCSIRTAPEDGRDFKIWAEGIVVAETDTQYKIKTTNESGENLGYTHISYPENDMARFMLELIENPKQIVKEYYWINKEKVEFLK